MPAPVLATVPLLGLDFAAVSEQKTVDCGGRRVGRLRPRCPQEVAAVCRGARPQSSALAGGARLKRAAIGNDYSYGLTFARQVKALGSPGDVVIALSTSGGSHNVLSAMYVAREREMVTAAFTGARGTELACLADIAVAVPSTPAARIQEANMLYMQHIMCELVEQELFGSAPIASLR